MAVYAIGDLQGCYEPLRRLLKKIAFDAESDTLWFTGDLINRGPASLETLRFVYSLGDNAVTVLGNHDLTLLAAAAGHVKPGRKDTLSDILDAADREELLLWLKHRPLMHHDTVLGFTLVHAGLAPQWDLAKAQSCARELESVLRSAACDDFLAQMFGQEPGLWRDELDGMDRLRCITNYMTRMRFCDRDGALALKEKGAPGSQPAHLMPWFNVPWRKNADLNIVFGHWAALGYFSAPGVHALDSGCVWGGRLSALRLDDRVRKKTVYHVDCP